MALVAPVVLLRRHKANLLSKSLEEAPPPRRTTTVTAGTAAIRPRQLAQHSPITAETCIQEMHSVSPPEAEDDFNGALHSLKAFGYATLIVMAGGLTTVWGVKTYMGVENVRLIYTLSTPLYLFLSKTQEFATRMRSYLQAKMPGLMARLHRPSTDEDDLPSATAAPSHGSPGSRGAIRASTGTTEWTWPDAEERLRMAFERGGITGWAEADRKSVV